LTVRSAACLGRSHRRRAGARRQSRSGYAQLKDHWDAEARHKLAAGRHPLAFENVTTIPDHATHMRTVAYQAKGGCPAIVIAASGMCSGVRIVNCLKAMLADPRHDVLFCGDQAAGTPGRDIVQFAPKAGKPGAPGKPGGYVVLDGQRIDIRANIHQIGGFSAHADQKDLLNFVSRIPKPPRQVRSGHPPLHSQKLSSSLPATRDLRSAVPTSDATEPRANPGHRGRHARGGG